MKTHPRNRIRSPAKPGLALLALVVLLDLVPTMVIELRAHSMSPPDIAMIAVPLAVPSMIFGLVIADAVGWIRLSSRKARRSNGIEINPSTGLMMTGGGVDTGGNQLGGKWPE